MANVSSSNGLEKRPKLRFPGFDEPWKEIKIGDIFKVTRGNVLSSALVSSEKSNGYTYPVFSSQTKDDGLMGYYNEFLFEDAITWTTDGANAGTVHFRKGKFYCTNVCGVLLNSYGYANRCIAEILGRVSKRYVSYVGNPKLMNNVMSEICIYIPSLAEQSHIDDFLLVLDKKIEKQRQLVDSLKKYKRGLSDELFSKNGATDDWTAIPFSEAFELLQNNTFSRDEMSTENGIVYNIHYGDVLIKYGAVVDLSKVEVPYIKSDVSLSKFAQHSYLKDGDIVIADTAEDYTVGKAVEIAGITDEKALSGLHTIPCRPKLSFAPMYLGYFINSNRFRAQILPLIQGTKVSSISKSEIMKTSVVFPSYEMQSRIASMLYTMDLKIDICNACAQKLIRTKEALMQRLFI